MKESENSQSSKENKGIIGRYFEENFPVIVKFVNEFPNESIRTKFPMLTVVSWKYDGEENNRMPPKEINEKMILLEGALETVMESCNLFRHAYSRTGNNLKEFVYYSTNLDDFMKVLNEALSKYERFPIEVNFYENDQWNEFKKLLDDFKQKN